MAKTQAVWGIDIGNTSLKALRCRPAVEPGKIEALACDFIEHSKVLSQPGTNAAEVLAETLQTFLSRNVTKGDRIAISVAGQSTISRFLPLPPVKPKKIPDVIRYEAKQWLPFNLNDVIFDFQPLSKPIQDAEDDTLVDATVGMFAIKRDVASKALAPYISQSVDIDCIQSSPLALYNFVAFDQLPPPPAENTEDDSTPESQIALCIGTDATDVVITNGETIWIRNIPLGGNSFTKALTRELQLTFSKAEYLKRNITISKDVDEQKRVITAMRPVFNDMVNEINRSLDYYQTLNRKAKFQKIVMLGNAAKLPGLRQFVSQNLGYEVVRLSKFNNLIGSEVIETQLFQDNLHSFGVSYGLALQQLGMSSLRTNLIPREVILNRIIREKKPWMLVAAAALLLGVTIQFAGVSSAHTSVANEAYTQSVNKAKGVQSFAADLKSKTASAVSEFTAVSQTGKQLTSSTAGRITWLELLRAINVALPQAQPGAEATIVKPATNDNFAKRHQVFIDSIQAISVNSLSEWFAPLKTANRYWPDDHELSSGGGTSGAGAVGSAAPGRSPLGGGALGGRQAGITAPAATPPSAPPTEEVSEGEATPTAAPTTPKLSATERYARVTGPTGSGPAKVVQIVGKHYHNPIDRNEFLQDGGEAFLRKTFLLNLKTAEVELPATLEEQKEGIKTKMVKLSDIGISYPVLLYAPKVVEEKIVNPDLPPQFANHPAVQAATAGSGGRGATGGGGQTALEGQQLQQIRSQSGVEPVLSVQRFDFVIQFAWVETPPSQRKSNTGGSTGAGADTNN